MAVTYGSGSFKTVSERTDDEDTKGLAEHELISRNIQKISHNVLQIKNMVQNIDTPLDSEELRHRMSILQGETSRLTKDTNTALKEISKPTAAADDKEQEKLKIKIRLLRENFHEVLKDYNDIQKTSKRKQRQTIRKKLRDSVTQGEESSVAQEDVMSGKMLQVEIVQGEVDIELVKEREEALHQLEQDILDINVIFKDLAIMVHDQGEDIDIIEENVDSAVPNVEEGVKHLQKAVDYQSSARRKKIFLVIILAAVLVVITVIIVVVVT